MSNPARLARWIFLVAGIYGIAVLLPQYFLEAELGRRFPPPPNHPEQFYGFLGVALAWQFAFLLIASDVRRYRAFMLPAVLEKVGFGAAAVVLHIQGRVAPAVLGAGVLDLLLGALFLLAFRLARYGGTVTPAGGRS